MRTPPTAPHNPTKTTHPPRQEREALRVTNPHRGSVPLGDVLAWGVGHAARAPLPPYLHVWGPSRAGSGMDPATGIVAPAVQWSSMTRNVRTSRREWHGNSRVCRARCPHGQHVRNPARRTGTARNAPHDLGMVPHQQQVRHASLGMLRTGGLLQSEPNCVSSGLAVAGLCGPRVVLPPQLCAAERTPLFQLLCSADVLETHEHSRPAIGAWQQPTRGRQQWHPPKCGEAPFPQVVAERSEVLRLLWPPHPPTRLPIAQASRMAPPPWLPWCVP